MKTVTRIVTETEKVQFGFWDNEKDDFVPVDIGKVADIQAAIGHFGCSEELIDAIGSMFERLQEAICADLDDIWKRLDDAEA
jgi:hypothetical protein